MSCSKVLDEGGFSKSRFASNHNCKGSPSLRDNLVSYKNAQSVLSQMKLPLTILYILWLGRFAIPIGEADSEAGGAIVKYEGNCLIVSSKYKMSSLI